MDLSGKLIALRKEKGLSQAQIAEMLFVSRQAVSKWEKGVSVPDIDNIIKLSEIFEVTTDYLLLGNNSEDSETERHEKVNIKVFNKSRVFILIGISVIALIVILSFFIPSYIKVYDVVTPSLIGEYSGMADEIFNATETVYHYEEITGNVIYFINTYYLHGVVFIALIFIFYGSIDMIRSYTGRRRQIAHSTV